jgi:hypothetical protein
LTSLNKFNCTCTYSTQGTVIELKLKESGMISSDIDGSETYNTVQGGSDISGTLSMLHNRNKK